MNEKNFDVVVVGGGTAGIASALASARTGVKTALIESSYLLGGLATSGMVTFYLPLCDGMGNQLCHGISEELLKLSISHGAEGPLPEEWLRPATREERDGKRYTVQYNPYVFAIEAEKLLAKEGVEILYGGTLSRAYTSENGDKIEKNRGRYKDGNSLLYGKIVYRLHRRCDFVLFSGRKNRPSRTRKRTCRLVLRSEKRRISYKAKR